MKFIEWPSKGKFIPLRDGWTTAEVGDQLVVDGPLPDLSQVMWNGVERKSFDRWCTITFEREGTKTEVYLKRTCRISVKARTHRVSYDHGNYTVDTSKVVSRGYGGARISTDVISYILQGNL